MSVKTNKEAIHVLATALANDPSCHFNGSTVRFSPGAVSPQEIESACNQLSLTCTKHLNSEFEIKIASTAVNGTIIFFNEKDFLNRAKPAINDFNNLHIVLLKTDTGVIEKTPNQSFDVQNGLIHNFYYYHKILDFLLQAEHFVSVKSDLQHQFVIFSSDKGPFDIKYNLHESRLKDVEDLSKVYQELTNEFHKVDFVQFFKSAVITALHQYDVADRFYHLVISLRAILNTAKRDHYIYIRNFDFEKIKTQFKEERNKYFESLEKSIDSISKQVTSFPLTFAASIFAAYQVKDRPAILVLVFLAYALYTIIAWKILSITEYNTECVKKDAAAEKDKIRSSYEAIHHDLEPDFAKVEYKIAKLESLIKILRTVLFGLLGLFLIFSVYQQFFAPKQSSQPLKVEIVNKDK